MGRFDGRVAVVTGAAMGNGRALAIRFAEDGANVVIADVDDAGMAETARLVKQQEREALTVRCDVSRPAEIEALMAATIDRFGRADIVVANAGVVERETDCLRMTEAQWDRTIDINLKGVFFTLQAGANRMVAAKNGGRLIAIGSIMGEWGSAGSPAYCASKGGVKQLVKSFAQAVGRFGITCNGIGPGFIDTAMTAPFQAGPFFDLLIDRTPVGGFGQPEDVAAVAAFLASDEARFVNGAMMFPDGGITAGGAYSGRLSAAMDAMRAAQP